MKVGHERKGDHDSFVAAVESCPAPDRRLPELRGDLVRHAIELTLLVLLGLPRDDLARGCNDCSALVGSFGARSLDDLADTDDEFAIHDAQEKGLIDEPIFAVS